MWKSPRSPDSHCFYVNVHTTLYIVRFGMNYERSAVDQKAQRGLYMLLYLDSICWIVVVVPHISPPLLWLELDVAHRIVQDATCYGHHYFRVSAVWSRFSCRAAFNTHSLYTNGERQLAASIVAPLRKTKPELSAHLLLISFRSYCIKNQLRSREWSKKRERASFFEHLSSILVRGANQWKRAEDHHSFSTLTSSRLIDWQPEWQKAMRCASFVWGAVFILLWERRFRSILVAVQGKESEGDLSPNAPAGWTCGEGLASSLAWKRRLDSSSSFFFFLGGKTHPAFGICVFISHSPWPDRGYIFD